MGVLGGRKRNGGRRGRKTRGKRDNRQNNSDGSSGYEKSDGFSRRQAARRAAGAAGSGSSDASSDDSEYSRSISSSSGSSGRSGRELDAVQYTGAGTSTVSIRVGVVEGATCDTVKASLIADGVIDASVTGFSCTWSSGATTFPTTQQFELSEVAEGSVLVELTLPAGASVEDFEATLEDMYSGRSYYRRTRLLVRNFGGMSTADQNAFLTRIEAFIARVLGVSADRIGLEVEKIGSRKVIAKLTFYSRRVGTPVEEDNSEDCQRSFNAKIQNKNSALFSGELAGAIEGEYATVDTSDKGLSTVVIVAIAAGVLVAILVLAYFLKKLQRSLKYAEMEGSDSGAEEFTGDNTEAVAEEQYTDTEDAEYAPPAAGLAAFAEADCAALDDVVIQV
jgi:hypothetical protein